MNYHQAFVAHAKRNLPDWQFSQIHHKAHSAAGGAAPRRGANQDEDPQEENEAMADEQGTTDIIQKDGQPAASDIHVDVPLGSEYTRRRKKRRPRPTPPDTAEIISKALDEVGGGGFASSLEAIGLGDAYAIACVALDAVGRPHAASVADALSHHHLAPLEQHPLFARICKRAGSTLPIVDAAYSKRVLYCVGLEPDSYDFQDDSMDAEDIEKTAHKFLTDSRIVGSMHRKAINAVPVESYIAPQDLVFEGGPFGKQIVKKGSWVLGIKINDPAEWEKVVQGDYTGISVGGSGQRKTIEGAA